MSILDSDRLLKRVWLANGLLILLALIVAAGVALFAVLSNTIGRDANAVAAPLATAARLPRHLTRQQHAT